MTHDPGGKVRLKLLPGVKGNAVFSPCGRFRHWLSREWGFRQYTGGREPYALWIGMNPSTAEANIDDPTIRKEMHFTKKMGLDCYVKCNIMDYRATNPSVLLSLIGEPNRHPIEAVPSSSKNLECIASFAQHASVVVVAWGALPRPLRQYADDVLATLGPFRLMCMGVTKDYSPRHPLYLRNDAQPIVWRDAL